MSDQRDERMAGLIDDLVADAAPVRLVLAPLALALAVIGLWGVEIAALATTSGLAPGLAERIAGVPLYWITGLGLLLAGVIGIHAGGAARIPGSEREVQRARWWAGGLLGGAMLAALVAHFAFDQPAWAGWSQDFKCLRGALVLGVVPGVLLVLLLLRGWVVEPGPGAVLALMGAAALGAVGVHLVCGITDARHLLSGHLSAPIVGVLVLGVPLATLLRRAGR